MVAHLRRDFRRDLGEGWITFFRLDGFELLDEAMVVDVVVCCEVGSAIFVVLIGLLDLVVSLVSSVSLTSMVLAIMVFVDIVVSIFRIFSMTGGL